MPFASTVTRRSVIGDLIMVIGQGVSTGGSTGGEVVTGLRRVEGFSMVKNGAAVDASQYAINETIPFNGSSVTTVTTADQTFTWIAIGTD